MLDFFKSNINRSVFCSKLYIVWYSIKLGYYTHYCNSIQRYPLSYSNRKTKRNNKKEIGVSILLAIFWWQQIGWSYCAGSWSFGLVAWRNTKKKVTLSEKHCPVRGAMVRSYSCYANGLRCDSRLPDFHFFSLLFSRFRLGQWLPTFFDTFLPLPIVKLFIPPLLHKFSRVAKSAKT